MQATADPGLSTMGSLTQANNNFTAIQTQLSATNAKFNAEKNDGGQVGNTGGSAGFFGKAITSIGVTAGATALFGPAGGAVAGAVMAMSDAGTFMSSPSPKPEEGPQYYSLKNLSLDKKDGSGYKASEMDPIVSDYTDSSGENYSHGFFRPMALTQPLSGSSTSPLLDKKLGRGDSIEMRKIIEERDTLLGKLKSNETQDDTTRGQAREMGMDHINKHVGSGPKPPSIVGSLGFSP